MQVDLKFSAKVALAFRFLPFRTAISPYILSSMVSRLELLRVFQPSHRDRGVQSLTALTALVPAKELSLPAAFGVHGVHGVLAGH